MTLSKIVYCVFYGLLDGVCVRFPRNIQVVIYDLKGDLPLYIQGFLPRLRTSRHD